MDYQSPSTSNAHSIQFEVRDDPEQRQKLDDCIELLVASGYFRARISGLKPFDKIVGGLVWCISLCNVSLDIDLLYSDNATIKQKIQVTEKIVRVLPLLECPYTLEPHQIQGLDCIHIYPVVQWLVKKAMEGRLARADEQETLIATITDRSLGKITKNSPAAVVSRFTFEEERKPKLAAKQIKTSKDELQVLEAQIKAALEENALLDDELQEERAQGSSLEQELRALTSEKERRDRLKENLSETELEEIQRLVDEMESIRAEEKSTKHEMREKIGQLEGKVERIYQVGQISADEDLIREWEESEAALQEERKMTGEVARRLLECQRQLDSTPSANEMAQYQQRFIELYNQMATLNRTTKQYHTLYNTLIDVQEFIEKESNLLNNIEQVLPDATKDEFRDSFAKNLQDIQRKVESTHSKLQSTNKQLEGDRANLASQLLNLKQLQRQFNILSEKFKQECEVYEASNK